MQTFIISIEIWIVIRFEGGILLPLFQWAFSGHTSAINIFIRLQMYVFAFFLIWTSTQPLIRIHSLEPATSHLRYVLMYIFFILYTTFVDVRKSYGKMMWLFIGVSNDEL